MLKLKQKNYRKFKWKSIRSFNIITKDSYAKGVSKTIPIFGGGVSGGISFASMDKMSNKLLVSLRDAMDMDEAEYKRNIEQQKRKTLK